MEYSVHLASHPRSRYCNLSPLCYKEPKLLLDAPVVLCHLAHDEDLHTCAYNLFLIFYSHVIMYVIEFFCQLVATRILHFLLEW